MHMEHTKSTNGDTSENNNAHESVTTNSYDVVKHLAELTRLSLSDDELVKITKEFDGILSYIGQIESLSLPEGAEQEAPLLRNVFREDANPTHQCTNTKELVQAFPHRKGDALSVKQIITYE